MDTSLYGDGWKDAVRLYDALEARHADVARAEARFESVIRSKDNAVIAAASDALDRADAALERTQDAYRALPHEADAWATAGQIRKHWS